MALWSPLAIPIPICATPLSFIIVLTSAKSIFIKPGIVIKSVIPWTPFFKTPSASLNASTIVVPFDTVFIRLLFSTTINASTFFFILAIPFSAFSLLLLPSNTNGFVTIPTVKIPIFLANSHTTGAAPVPVPPPIPAVTNTISAPSNNFFIFSSSSLAAISPNKGFEPAPNPFVVFFPIWSWVSAFDCVKACSSVFIAINCTFCIPSSIILFTALFPAPPTPITFIFTKSLFKFSCSV